MGGYRAIGKKGLIDRALSRLEEEESQVVKIVDLGFCILWRRLWLVCGVFVCFCLSDHEDGVSGVRYPDGMPTQVQVGMRR